MIILPNKRLAFVAVPKCASTSIESLLSRHRGIFIAGTPGLKHMPYKGIERFVFPMLASYGIERPHFFAIVRDPVDRLLSWYKYRTRDVLLRAGEDSPRARKYVGHMAFPEFCEEALARRPKPEFRFRSQISFVEASDGTIGIDTLIRMEAIREVIPLFLSHFKIRGAKSGLPEKNKSPSSSVPIQIDDGLRAKIIQSERYRRDWELYESAIASKEQLKKHLESIGAQ